MTLGKNKKIVKKKGKSKKIVDPFSRKEWYDIKAPRIFSNPHVGKTPVNKLQGTKNPIDFLKGRVFEVSLADLNKNEADGHVKFRLRADEIQGKNVLTNFHGLSFTSDRMKSLVRKWQSTISADVLVKTTDDYLLRLFVIAFTKRNQNQKKKTSYAQSAQIHDIRKKINQIVTKEVSVGSLKELVTKLIPNTIGQRIEKQASWIYPLKDVFVYKVKIVNAPKYDSAALLDLYGDNILDAGAAVARPAAAAAAPAAEASA